MLIGPKNDISPYKQGMITGTYNFGKKIDSVAKSAGIRFGTVFSDEEEALPGCVV